MTRRYAELATGWLATLGPDARETPLDYVDPRVAYRIYGSTPISGTHLGLEELGAALGDAPSRLKSFSISATHVVAQNDWVAMLATGSGETVDGEPYVNNYAFFLRFEGERIAEVNEVFDTVALEKAFFGRELRD